VGKMKKRGEKAFKRGTIIFPSTETKAFGFG